MSNNMTQRARFLRPRSAVNESADGQLHVVLEMPGVKKEGLEVRIENNELTISGRRERAAQGRYVLRERPQGDFMQTFTLDGTVDQGKVDAVLEKGILTLTLDLKEQVKPRKIQVRGE
ncbi:MAG TPA: Hsp20/alpha crystallin family protein [Spirochaetia bacterium]|nr:Hsp20/alpha crystallin family protein [Spirochaetia bacterium]